MPTLECKNLCKRYGGVQALDNVSFTVEPGRVVGLLGPNGSGKTTLIKLANGLLSPNEGEILICGSHPGPDQAGQRPAFPHRRGAADKRRKTGQGHQGPCILSAGQALPAGVDERGKADGHVRRFL